MTTILNSDVWKDAEDKIHVKVTMRYRTLGDEHPTLPSCKCGFELVITEEQLLTMPIAEAEDYPLMDAGYVTPNGYMQRIRDMILKQREDKDGA